MQSISKNARLYGKNNLIFSASFEGVKGRTRCTCRASLCCSPLDTHTSSPASVFKVSLAGSRWMYQCVLLPPTWEMWVEFWAPGFSLAQSQQLRTVGKWTSQKQVNLRLSDTSLLMTHTYPKTNPENIDTHVRKKKLVSQMQNQNSPQTHMRNSSFRTTMFSSFVIYIHNYAYFCTYINRIIMYVFSHT